MKCVQSESRVYIPIYYIGTALFKISNIEQSE